MAPTVEVQALSRLKGPTNEGCTQQARDASIPLGGRPAEWLTTEPKTMIQCQDCEYFHRDEKGRISLSCDPFTNVKEPTCLQKWQLIKINQMVESYQTTLSYYQKLAPMQDKLFKAMEQELNEMEDSDKWKHAQDEEDQEEEEE